MSQLRDVLFARGAVAPGGDTGATHLECTRSTSARWRRCGCASTGRWLGLDCHSSHRVWSRQGVVAYEALMRTTDTELSSPMENLKTAEALNEMSTLGRKDARLVADVLRKHPELPGVFVNLHVLDLADEDLYSPTRRFPSLPRAFISRSPSAWHWRESPTSRARGPPASLGLSHRLDDLE